MKVLLAIYPLTIIFCIVVTANHWILDAVGGWIVLGLGYAGALGIEALGRAIREGRRRGADAGTALPRSGV